MLRAQPLQPFIMAPKGNRVFKDHRVRLDRLAHKDLRVNLVLRVSKVFRVNKVSKVSRARPEHKASKVSKDLKAQKGFRLLYFQKRRQRILRKFG